MVARHGRNVPRGTWSRCRTRNRLRPTWPILSLGTGRRRRPPFCTMAIFFPFAFFPVAVFFVSLFFFIFTLWIFHFRWTRPGGCALRVRFGGVLRSPIFAGIMHPQKVDKKQRFLAIIPAWNYAPEKQRKNEHLERAERNSCLKKVTYFQTGITLRPLQVAIFGVSRRGRKSDEELWTCCALQNAPKPVRERAERVRFSSNLSPLLRALAPAVARSHRLFCGQFWGAILATGDRTGGHARRRTRAPGRPLPLQGRSRGTGDFSPYTSNSSQRARKKTRSLRSVCPRSETRCRRWCSVYSWVSGVFVGARCTVEQNFSHCSQKRFARHAERGSKTGRAAPDSAK